MSPDSDSRLRHAKTATMATRMTKKTPTPTPTAISTTGTPVAVTPMVAETTARVVFVVVVVVVVDNNKSVLPDSRLPEGDVSGLVAVDVVEVVEVVDCKLNAVDGVV
jgi:hypothetical protein